MKINRYILVLIVILGNLGIGPQVVNAQSAGVDTIDYWDNQMYLSNRFTWSKNSWRYTGEFQIRLHENNKVLDQYFIEGVASYMLNPKIEIIPDFRVTVKSLRYEFRPGLGFIYKQTWGENRLNQLAHQVKYQADFESPGDFKQGLRYILFHTVVINEQWLFSSAGGGMYRWSPDFNGLQFGRAMMGLAYSFDKKHIISFNYFVGAENQGDYWTYIGGPYLQLTIRFDDDFKYVPARYISF